MAEKVKNPSMPNKAWRETLDCIAPAPGQGKVSLPVPTCRKDPTPRRIPPQAKPAPSITHDELWSAIRQAEADSEVARAVPDGWITAYDYIEQKRAGGVAVGRSAAYRFLNDLVKHGVFITRLAMRGGKIQRCWGLPSKLNGDRTISKDRP